MGGGVSTPAPDGGNEDEEVVLLIPSLKALPEAMETVLYVHEKWPLIVDPTEQAGRFLRYQRGSFLMGSSQKEMEPEHLRQLLVGCLKMGSMMTLSFETLKGVDLDALFVEGSFPRAVLSRTELHKEAVWSSLLRPEKGDPEPHAFIPRDDFALCVVVREPFEGDLAHFFGRIEIQEGAVTSTKKKEEEELESVLGGKEVIRHSEALVEAAFEGQLEEVRSLVEKGFYVDSCDARKHTALSDAAQQGQLAVAEYLLELGADPNAKSDQSRTPIWRAAFNGHGEMVQLLLQSGADPTILTKSFERAFDVAKDDATRTMISEWPSEETARLLQVRTEAIQKAVEERLRTSAQREAHAREVMRLELVEIAVQGKVDELKTKLEDIVDNCLKYSERPRVTANSARDDRGATLLHIAAQHGHMPLLTFLLNPFKESTDDTPAFQRCVSTLEAGRAELEKKVYSTSVNRRDSKGWTPVSVAVFHDQKPALLALLEHGGDPELFNQYGHNAWKLAQDEMASDERTVLRDRSEIRKALEEWANSRSNHLFKDAKLPATSKNAEPLPDQGTAVELQIEMSADAQIIRSEAAQSKKANNNAKKTVKKTVKKKK